MRVLIATANPGKQREFRDLAPDGWDIIFPDALGAAEKPREDGATFAENALLGARFYRRFYPEHTLAEDSNLVVPALGGRPGIRSARYAPTEAECRRKLLDQLSGVPRERRAAYYLSALVFLDPAGAEVHAEGRLDGFIALEESGASGSGCDPVSYWPPAQTTLGNLPPEIKNEVSHRACAFRALLALLPASLH
jgi:XTP/dITP diphosphohydrolase